MSDNYKSALKLMITSGVNSKEQPPVFGVPSTNVKDEPPVFGVPSSTIEDPKPSNKPTLPDAVLNNDLEKPNSTPKAAPRVYTPEEKEALKRIERRQAVEREKAIAELGLSPTEVAERAYDAAGGIILNREDQFLSTDEKKIPQGLDKHNEIIEEMKPWHTPINRKQQKIVEDQKAEKKRKADEIAQKLTNATLDQVKSSNEGINPESIANGVTSGLHTQSTSSTININQYIKIFMEYNLNYSPKDLSAMNLYIILETMDRDKPEQNDSKIKGRVNNFNHYVYKIVGDIATTGLSKDQQQIISNKPKFQEEFCQFLLRMIKEALTFMSEPINEYLSKQSNSELGKLNAEKIDELVKTSGGFINQLVNEAMLKKDYFIAPMLQKLADEIKHSAISRTDNEIFNILTHEENLKRVIEAMTSDALYFDSETDQAKTISVLYEQATHNNKYSSDYGGTELNNSKENKENSTEPYYKIKTDYNPDSKVYSGGFDHEKEISKKDDSRERLATQGELRSSPLSPALNYHVFIPGTDRIIIRTSVPDVEAQHFVEKHLSELSKSENISSVITPKNEWDKILVFMGRRLLGIEEVNRKVKKITNRDEVEEIRQRTLAEYDVAEFTDYKQIVDKAITYVKNNPDIFYLAATFDIDNDGNVSKVSDNVLEMRRIYHVKFPMILKPYRQFKSLSMKEASYVDKIKSINITGKDSLSDVYRKIIKLF